MFKSYFGDRKSRKKDKRNQYQHLGFESLEGRALMANDILISGNDFVTSQDGDKAIFSVTLSDAPVNGSPVKITFTVSDSTQAKLSKTTLTFKDTDFNKPHLLTVTGKNSQVAPSDYTVDGVFASGDPAYANAETHISLHNVDKIGEILGAPKSAKTSEEGGAPGDKPTDPAKGIATVKLKLNFVPTAPVTINLHSDNAAEGVPDVTQVIFTGTEEHVIKIVGQPDGVKGTNPKYNIVFDAATSTDLRFVGLQLPPIKMTNTDKAATIKVSDKSLTTNELGGTDVFSVVLSQRPTAPVDVPLQLEVGAFVSVDKPVLHFDDLNWNVPQIVTVTGQDDGQPGTKDIKYKIDLLAAVSTDPKYANLDVKTNVVTVKNVHRYDGKFDGHYVGDISGRVMGLFPLDGTLDATISDGVVTLTSLSVVISSTPLGDVEINTSGAGIVAASGNKLLVSFQFANDGSLLSGREIKNIPLTLVDGEPTLKGTITLTFDGSVFGVGDVPVQVTLNITKS